MRILIESSTGEVMLEAVSDGESRWTLKCERGGIPRTDPLVNETTTDDGLYVLGLAHSIAQALDSGEYLRRRLKQHDAEEATEEATP